MRKLNRSAQILQDLSNKGGTKLLNEPQHIAAAKQFNEFMDKVKRDYKIKSRKSEESAAKIILTS